MDKWAARLLRGAVAGLAASTVQVIIGKLEEKLLPLPPHEDADIAPRLVGKVAENAGIETTKATRWTLGTLFHFGYGALWGMGYAATVEKISEKRPVDPLLGGTLLGTLIYVITFPNWGGAVKTRTERPPEQRSPGFHLITWSVALTYGIATGLFYGRPRKSP